MPKVDLKRRVSIQGKTYEPAEGGVDMPRPHADALGFDPDEYLKEDNSDLPEDLPKRDELKDDDRFDSKAKLKENADALTEVDGVGDKTAESIIEGIDE